MDTNYVNQLIFGLKDAVNRLTSGNVSHLRPSLIWAIDELEKEIIKAKE